MSWLTSFLTSLIASVVRPIIEDAIKDLIQYLENQYLRKKDYERFDEEAVELSEAMAEASTSEERYAILQRIKSASPKLNSR